jgi:geranylgeranyl transferase type-2 subunit beta
MSDVFHLFFGVCGLSMLGTPDLGLKPVNAAYALPQYVVDRMKLSPSC